MSNFKQKCMYYVLYHLVLIVETDSTNTVILESCGYYFS